MSNPLGAILAGLGAGASTAGQSMDERAMLTLQNKRQAALDAIARAQKLDEMGLTEDDGSGPGLANPSAVTPPTIGLQTGMSGGANTPPPVVSPSDLAMKKLYTIPNAQGGVDQYRKKTASELAQDPKAVYEQQKQQEEQDRATTVENARDTFRQTLADRAAARNAIDPALWQAATGSDPVAAAKAQAQILSTHPQLSNTPLFNKPAALPKNIDPLSPEGIAAEVKKAGAVKAAEVANAGPKPVGQAEVDKQEQLAQLLPLMKSDHGILGTTPEYAAANPQPKGAGGAAEVPGRIQQGLSSLPGQIGTGANTQAFNQAAEDWMLQYSQSLRTRGITPPTIAILRQTFIPSGANASNPTVIAQKAQRREQAMEQIRVRSGAKGAANPYADKPDDE